MLVIPSGPKWEQLAVLFDPKMERLVPKLDLTLVRLVLPWDLTWVVKALGSAQLLDLSLVEMALVNVHWWDLKLARSVLSYNLMLVLLGHHRVGKDGPKKKLLNVCNSMSNLILYTILTKKINPK